MLKSIWNASAIVLVLHLVAGLLLLGWLQMSDRFNRDRLMRVYEIFEPTIAQEQIEQEQAQQCDDRAREHAARLSHMEEVGQGPLTMADRLDKQRQNEELSLYRAERERSEVHALRQLLENGKEALRLENKKLQAQRDAFEQAITQKMQLQQDVNFKRAVDTIEKLNPLQTKQLFRQMINDGRETEVVDYLAAMQLRKSAKVLKQFQTSQEITQATKLIEKLRDRGIVVSPEFEGKGRET